MTDIDRYLDQACRSVSGPVALRQHLRKELKEHLEEAIRDLVASGMSEDEATTNAMEAFGTPEMIREGLQSVYGHSVVSLFVDQAMKWKESTMKSEWKWNFVTQAGLLLVIALSVFGCVFTMYWIVPVVEQFHRERGTEILPQLQAAIAFSYHIVDYWLIWAIPIAAALWQFERKCKSENKGLIRIAISVGACLVSIAILLWWAGVTIISLAMTVRALQ